MLFGSALATLLRYAFQVLSARWFGPAGFGVISNLFSWVLTIVGLISSGTSLALVRYIALQEAKGESARPVVRAGLLVQAAIMAGLVVFIVLLRRPLADQLFGGDGFLLFVLLGGVLGQGVMGFLLGILRGFRSFGLAACVIVALPAARVALAALLGPGLGYGVRGVAWAILLAPVAAVALAIFFSKRLLSADDTPDDGSLPLRKVLSFALPATLMTGILYFLPRSGVILTNLLATENVEEAVGIFAAALLLARLPELLIESLSSPLLSNYSRAAARGDSHLLRRYVLGSTLLIGAFGLVYTVALTALGPALIPLLYGKAFSFPRFDLALLAISTGGYSMGQIHSQIVMVRRGATYVSLIWVAGTVLLVALAVLLPLPLFRRLEWSYILATWLVAALLAFQSFRGVPGAEEGDALMSVSAS